MEVVQRMGYDSYSPDSGVLLAMNTGTIGDRDEMPLNEAHGGAVAGDVDGAGHGRAGLGWRPDPATLYFNWVIDAHPEDMNRLDFRRPNGEAVMRSIADYRQLNDALFHAGLNSGGEFEYVDRPNGLHFYVIDLENGQARSAYLHCWACAHLDGGRSARSGGRRSPAHTTDDERHLLFSSCKHR